MNVDRAVDALGALAQPQRLAIFRLLVETGPDGLAAGEIARRLDCLPSSLSFHLGLMERAGLLSRTRDGRRLLYATNFPAMDALVDFLTENCCGGAAGRCAPQSRKDVA